VARRRLTRFLRFLLAAGVAPVFAEEPILGEAARRAIGRAWIQMAPESNIALSMGEISRRLRV